MLTLIDGDLIYGTSNFCSVGSKNSEATTDGADVHDDDRCVVDDPCTSRRQQTKFTLCSCYTLIVRLGATTHGLTGIVRLNPLFRFYLDDETVPSMSFLTTESRVIRPRLEDNSRGKDSRDYGAQVVLHVCRFLEDLPNERVSKKAASKLMVKIFLHCL